MKLKIKNVMDSIMEFILKYKRYFGAAIVFVLMMAVLFGMVAKKSDTTDEVAEETAPQEYSENDNAELDALINNYYVAAASGDTATLEAIATPMSDEEKSYIEFYSQYVESYNDIQIFTKQGLDEGSYLVSCQVNLKFVDIDTPAPGLDFFYVQTNEDGALYINNLYGSFNQANGIYDMDTEVTTLIATFISQDDVLAKQTEVQQAYNEALLNDENLNNFVSNTLKDAIVQWSIDYQAQVEAAEAEAAQAEADAEAAAAAEEQAAQEEANKQTGVTNDSINVRESADRNSSKLGTLEKGTEVTVYAEEGDFYKIDYEGNRAYAIKTGIDISDGTEDTAEETDEDEDEGTTTTTANLSAGDEVTLSSTVNIRSKMDTSSSKIAVAYAGEKVTVVMTYAEGWTKVKYGTKEGYIKTDLLTE